ncbi:MAG TPA: hypothetical protein VKQ36_11595, partial [Ktedonobacterales bacterium]|nr:hypothetical protein [Ktedonobacterales bacterium]
MAFGTNDTYSTWAGLGGVSGNLMQAGVDGVNASIAIHYYVAWIENLGANYNVDVFDISCGDLMFSEV